MTRITKTIDGKNVTLIVSGGRTGTTFLGKTLSKQIEDCFSVHEPDVVTGLDRRTYLAIRDFGINQAVLGKFTGKKGIRNINFNYLSGRWGKDKVGHEIYLHRSKYYSGIKQSLVIESCYQWFGLLPVCVDVFKNLKIVIVTRDPRSWVQSWINYGGHHDRRDLVTFLGMRRLTPALVDYLEKKPDWESISLFEKICWEWELVYKKLLSDSKKITSNIQIVRFEDLFESENRRFVVRDLLGFITSYDRIEYRAVEDMALFDEKINASSRSVMRGWEEWGADDRRTLHRVCGTTMQCFGYGDDEGWLDSIEP